MTGSWINATWSEKVIVLINNSWSWGRGTPLASFLRWGSRCRVRVMGRLSAVAQQLARRPLSKGTAVCFGHRWLWINKMDDTIWIRTWNTPWYLFFPPVIYNSARVRPTHRWWWHWVFFLNRNNSIVLHLGVTQSCTVRVSSYLPVPQNSGSCHASPIRIPFRFIEELPRFVRQRRPILKSLIPPSLRWLLPCRQRKFNLTIRFSTGLF